MGKKIDSLAIIGIFVGFGAILLANVMEGGHFSALFQFSAAVIVFGGTAGATILSNSSENLSLGIEQLKSLFSKESDAEESAIAKELLTCAVLARKESLLSIEKRMSAFSDPYMKKVFRFVVDGTDGKVMKTVFERELAVEEERLLGGAKVWSDAGGYAPTVGILGAVLGLIHVMANISDTASLGKGIAVAFVATIYGVGFANLIFIPISNRIKAKVFRQMRRKEMILDGAVGIVDGYNPYLVQENLHSYLNIPMSSERP